VLVYYSPAFVRQLTPSHAKDALRLLAEVYRRARSLWPLRPEDELGLENETVTVRIDQIKELNLFDIQSIYAGGESWCLSKRNAKEGVIERQPLDVLAKSLQKDTYKVLKFWRVMNETKTSDDFYNNSMHRHVMHAVGRAVQQHMQGGKKEGNEDESDSLSNSEATSNPAFQPSSNRATPRKSSVTFEDAGVKKVERLSEGPGGGSQKGFMSMFGGKPDAAGTGAGSNQPSGVLGFLSGKRPEQDKPLDA